MKIYNNWEIYDYPYLFLLLLIPIFFIWYYMNRNRDTGILTLSTTNLFSKKDDLSKYKIILYTLRILALVCLIVAVSRPRMFESNKKINLFDGLDIVMAVDVSGSMLSEDLKPNRISALKEVAVDFVSGRVNDRFALVSYAGESFTKCPLTTDKSMVVSAIKDLNYGVLEDGTSIGMGLGTAINRLKNSRAKSKIIILLTDGVNTSGFVEPLTVTEIAKEKKIKIYTIGIGTNGVARSPYAINPSTNQLLFRDMEVKIDEKLLKEIANKTNGKYFRATDNNKLKSIYEEIDKLEKTKLKEVKYYTYDEKYRFFSFTAIIFVIIEFMLRILIFKNMI